MAGGPLDDMVIFFIFVIVDLFVVVTAAAPVVVVVVVNAAVPFPSVSDPWVSVQHGMNGQSAVSGYGQEFLAWLAIAEGLDAPYFEQRAVVRGGGGKGVAVVLLLLLLSRSSIDVRVSVVQCKVGNGQPTAPEVFLQPGRKARTSTCSRTPCLAMLKTTIKRGRGKF